MIMAVYRDEVYHEDTPDKGIAEIIILKRNGPIGRKVGLCWTIPKFVGSRLRRLLRVSGFDAKVVIDLDHLTTQSGKTAHSKQVMAVVKADALAVHCPLRMRFVMPMRSPVRERAVGKEAGFNHDHPA